MNERQAWEMFRATGNVEAYLLYAELKSKEQQNRGEKNLDQKDTGNHPQSYGYFQQR
mgnify:CR=1 FL=1